MRFSDAYGFYELNPFPGCNQLIVSNHAVIYQDQRGKGYGQHQHIKRLEQIKLLGFDYVICTVNTNNAGEKHILKKFGWKMLDDFHNKETGNLVEIWGRKIG